MDTDMLDVAYDIDFDVGASIEPTVMQPQQIQEHGAMADKTGIPAAYLEDAFTVTKPWPECLNLQGVNNFDPNDPLYYAIEHCGPTSKVKQLRWVNDSSVNLEFYNAQDAATALALLTSVEVANPGLLDAQTARMAKPYAKFPNSVLMIRETNDGDQKPKGAAHRSNYYKHNPDVAGNRQKEPRRRPPPPPKRDYLDYGDDDSGSTDRFQRRRRSGVDDDMTVDQGFDRQRGPRNGRDQEFRDNRGRPNREADSGRLRNDVDSYRPGSKSPDESRFGRLRGRSASPAFGEEGDGRYGFAEDNIDTGRHRYRSRSRSRGTRRRAEPTGDRWVHDRSNYDRTPGSSGGGRWQKDSSMVDSSPMGNHRRSDAMDASRVGGGNSLLSRMTKDGQPVLAPGKRSLADRITRDGDDDDMSYGRLKDDDRDPYVTYFSEPAPKRGLADRMTRDDTNVRERGQDGINIRGSASSNGPREGINIRGVANGA